MSSARFYKRQYSLVIEDEISGKRLEFSDLDIKFSIQRWQSQMQFAAKIDILGLGKDTINKLVVTATLSQPDAIMLRKRIELRAGYKGNMPLLFIGYIENATVDPPPDMWVHILASNYLEMNNEILQLDIPDGSTPNDAVRNLGRLLDLNVKNLAEESGNGKVGASTFRGSKTAILSSVGKLVPGWNVFVDLNTLFVVDSRKPSDNTFLIDIDHGLLSVSGVDFQGITATTLLQDPGVLARKIKVKSLLYPTATATYNLISREFKGHYRGKEWYSTFKGCMKNGHQ